MNLRLVDADASLVFQNFKILRWIGFLFFRIKKFSVGRDEVVEGWYCVADSHVVLTDADGKALGTKRHLNAGDDARLIACRWFESAAQLSNGERIQRQADLSEIALVSIRAISQW